MDMWTDRLFALWAETAVATFHRGAELWADSPFHPLCCARTGRDAGHRLRIAEPSTAGRDWL